MADEPAHSDSALDRYRPTRGDLAASIATVLLSLASPVGHGHGFGPTGICVVPFASSLLVGRPEPSLAGAWVSLATLVVSAGVLCSPLIPHVALRRAAMLGLSIALASLVIALGHIAREAPGGNPLEMSLPFSIPMLGMVLVNTQRLSRSAGSMARAS